MLPADRARLEAQMDGARRCWALKRNDAQLHLGHSGSGGVRYVVAPPGEIGDVSDGT